METVRRLADAFQLGDDDREAFFAAVHRPIRRRPTSRNACGDQPPQQLPAAVADFTGRLAIVAELRQILSTPTRDSPAVVISAIAGMGGVGKTTLALQVAHSLADEFPDGRLYINLRGFGPGAPMSPIQALGVLLRALDVPSREITTDVDGMAARLRSRLAGRRVLMVLDNANSASQVVSLLPGTPGSAAIITSRRSLNTLPGVHHFPIDVLSEQDAIELLAAIAGRERVNHELDAARRLVECVGRLPLAIRIAGARLAARTAWPISHLARRLDDERRRLDELAGPDHGVRACLAHSREQLHLSDDEAVCMFDALGILNCSLFGVSLAAQLVDIPEARAEQVLERLVDSNLLETPAPGRYTFHDLVRAYSQERALEISEYERDSALARVLALFTMAAKRTHADFFSESVRLDLIDARWPETDKSVVNDAEEARALLDVEIDACEEVLRRSCTRPGFPAKLIVAFGLAQYGYCRSRHKWSYWQLVCRLALDAAEATHDLTAEGVLRRDLGWALHETGDHHAAIDELRLSQSIFRELGQKWWEAWAYCNLSHVFEALRRLAEAVECAEQSLAISKEIGDPNRTASAYICLGNIHASAGNLAGQHSAHRESLAIYENLGRHPTLAAALYEVGVAYRRTGQYDYAVVLLEQSVDMMQSLHHLNDVVKGLAELGTVHALRDAPDDAQQSYVRALEVLATTDDPRSEAEVRYQFGALLASIGRGQDAEDHWRRALEIYENDRSARAFDVRHRLSQSQIAGPNRPDQLTGVTHERHRPPTTHQC